MNGENRQKIKQMDEQGRIQGRSLQDIGDEVGLTRERVRQILNSLHIKKERFFDGKKHGQNVRERAQHRWDMLAQALGFADFQALAEELGFKRQWSIKRVAQALDRSQCVTGKKLKQYGYAPPRGKFPVGIWKGRKQAPEHLANRIASYNRTVALKKRLGIPFRCPKREWEYLIKEPCNSDEKPV